jgi:hypothetical protein
LEPTVPEAGSVGGVVLERASANLRRLIDAVLASVKLSCKYHCFNRNVVVVVVVLVDGGVDIIVVVIVVVVIVAVGVVIVFVVWC